MKKIIGLTAAFVVAAPAFGQGIVLGPPQFDSYSNRGRCESALAHERNSQRKNPATRGAGYENLSGSEFNRASRTTTRCELRDGEYVVVFYQTGFPEDDLDD